LTNPNIHSLRFSFFFFISPEERRRRRKKENEESDSEKNRAQIGMLMGC